MSAPIDWIHHNLHTKRVSVRRLSNGRRVESFESVQVRDATPHVSAAGRAKVLATGVRSVHATIRGEVWVEVSIPGARSQTEGMRRITYNPHRCGHFTYSDTGEEWTGSARIVVEAGYVWEVTR